MGTHWKDSPWNSVILCLRKIALAAQWRYPWSKGRVPTGRPFGKPCRKESRPESMVAWRDGHVRKMVEEDSSTTSPSQGACLRPVHSMQRETHCSPPTGGNGPEVA